LVDSSNKNTDNLLHDKDMNKFVKSHIKEQAKSSAKHILSNLYHNIYYAPQPETQTPPQSNAKNQQLRQKKAHSSHIYMMLLLMILKVKVMKE